MIEAVGFLGGLSLAVCALPQCWHAYKGAELDGLSWAFLGLWGSGEVLSLCYAVYSLGADPYLLLNYGLNICAIAFLLAKKSKVL